MNTPRDRILFVVLILLLGTPSIAAAQGIELKVEPTSIRMGVGESVTLSIATLKDGEPVELAYGVYSRARRSVEVMDRNTLKAHKPGTFNVSVVLPVDGGDPVRQEVEVIVAYPRLESVMLSNLPDQLYIGDSRPLDATVVDVLGFERDDVELVISSSDPTIGSIDEFQRLRVHAAGSFVVTVSAGELTVEQRIVALPNPTVRINMSVTDRPLRTGDVVTFGVEAVDASGNVIVDAPIQFSLLTNPDDFRGAPASAELQQDGRFVAEQPGLYTIVARSGSQSVEQTIRVSQRQVAQDVEVVGHGEVLDVHTSDLWVWEGVDGRDYAITGTWSAKGDTYFWDVTDPTNIVAIDTITVDARTVNDVKVNEAGDVCVISREGASNRKNGIVILDCSDPSNVSILSEYDDELTGGVHNVFIYDSHVYAVNNGRRYDIINIEDPRNPVRVGRFELDTPGHSIHDVWIEDGIAYSSNWADGLQLVDIGSGTERKPASTDDATVPHPIDNLPGGTPENPIKVASYTYPSGWNHAAFPFKSQSTGKFFVVAGDEAFPYPTKPGAPEIAAGWLHFVDFTDLNNPKEVARYQVPEAGSHNYWIDGDVLYAAMYNGGLRVVDISGELMGDLYRQGREIAWFRPTHTESVVPNAPMVWGPMPYKGLVFMSDHYSGLWAVRLVPKNDD